MKKRLFTIFAVLFVFCGLTSLTQAQDSSLVQIIHNSADIDGRSVDVYLNDVLALDDLKFRTATPFFKVAAGDNNVKVTPDDQAPADSTIFETTLTTEADKNYAVIANGILPVNADKYTNPDPMNQDNSFQLFVIPDAQLTSVAEGFISFVGFHGSTDAPTIDIVSGGVPLVNDAPYGANTGYLTIPTPTGPTELDITPADDNATILASFAGDLTTLNNVAFVVFASGFLTPEDDEGGQALGLYAAFPNGDIVELERIIRLDPGPWQLAENSWMFESVFEDTTVAAAHGVAVDGEGKVWSGSFGSGAAGIIVRWPNGNEASFSPLAEVTVDGEVIDLSGGGCRGMTADNDGNIIYAVGARLIKIDHQLGSGMATWVEPEGNSLVNPSVDDEGFVYTGRVVGVNPFYILNADLGLEQTATLPGAASFARGVAVSGDGTTAYAGDLGGSGGPVRQWKTEDFINWSLDDSLFADNEGNMIFTAQRTTMNWAPDGKLWVSQDAAYNPDDNTANSLVAFDFATNEYFYVPMPDLEPGTGNGPRNVAFNAAGDTAYVASFNYGNVWRFVKGISNSVTDNDGVQPSDYGLFQNYPNPFNPATVIPYNLESDAFVTLKVYDNLGREIAVLVEDKQPAGRHQVIFDASKFATGVYHYQLKVGEQTYRKKMLFVK